MYAFIALISKRLAYIWTKWKHIAISNNVHEITKQFGHNMLHNFT